MFDYAADVDAVFADYPFLDSEYPISNIPVVVESGGTTLFGELATAPGAGRKGTVILIPPMGSGDDLDSLVIPLNYAGIHVLQFWPRGTSREGEPYSLPQTVDDVHALVDWIAQNAGKTVAGKPPLQLDPNRIALCGLGIGGGNVALAACAESKIANFAIALAAGSIEAQTTAEYLARERAKFRAIKEASGGEIDIETWLSSLTQTEKVRLSVTGQASRLIDKHVLMVGAKHDDESPISSCHEPNVKALRAAGAKHITEVILDTDHLFLTKRYALARLLISWLRTEAGFKP